MVRDPRFTQKIIDAARLAEMATGCLASVQLAQWALESAYGTLCAAPNNYFGMKWYKGCPYPPYEALTHEYEAGHMMPYRLPFQSFPDLPTAFLSHAKLLTSMTGPYARCHALKSNWRLFIHAIAPIYATDPQYESKLQQIITNNDLTAFDNGQKA